jgi:hypothetical protein
MMVIVKDKRTADRVRASGISYPIEVNPDYVEECRDGLYVVTEDESESVHEAVRLEKKIHEALEAEKAFRNPDQHFIGWYRNGDGVVRYGYPPIEPENAPEQEMER